MKIFRHIESLSRTLITGCVATIGNFDGIHLGHQKILHDTVTKARSLKLPALAIIFEPQPAELFFQEDAPKRLMSLREKLFIFESMHFDFVWVIHFTRQFSHYPPKQFVEEILLKQLKIKHLMAGEDFHFGGHHLGDVSVLENLSTIDRFGFTCIHDLTLADIYPKDDCFGLSKTKRISSSWVRELLHEGNFVGAKLLLGRDYFMMGRVIHGDKRGRILGCPTANLQVKVKQPILYGGVYIVRIKGLGNELYFGVANLGKRPTFQKEQLLLEVNLLNFNQDIYGKLLTIEFLKFLRDEKKFESKNELIKQLKDDVEKTKEWIR